MKGRPKPPSDAQKSPAPGRGQARGKIGALGLGAKNKRATAQTRPAPRLFRRSMQIKGRPFAVALPGMGRAGSAGRLWGVCQRWVSLPWQSQAIREQKTAEQNESDYKRRTAAERRADGVYVAAGVELAEPENGILAEGWVTSSPIARRGEVLGWQMIKRLR